MDYPHQLLTSVKRCSVFLSNVNKTSQEYVLKPFPDATGIWGAKSALEWVRLNDAHAD